MNSNIIYKMSVHPYQTWIEEAFLSAENKEDRLPMDILKIDGMSGNKTRICYNHLLSHEDVRYLEIGTWKGSTVCGAMYNNKATVVCIDNWSEFGGPKDEFLSNFEKYKGENNARFIEQNCFSVDLATLPKFNIYMYDGNHSYQSHFMALSYYYERLDDVFIYIVDDWNTDTIRDATRNSIQALNFKVLYEKEYRSTMNNQHVPVDIGRENWWNGIYMVVLQKPV